MSDHDQAAGPSAGPSDKPDKPRLRAYVVKGAVIALALATVGLTGCPLAQKAELDREVDRLCAIDGGVHVYEVVRLSKENFGPDGEVFPQYRRSSTEPYGPKYRSVLKKDVLVSGDPTLTRTVWQVVRQEDMKVLGEVVYYSRAGGDLPGPSAPSGRTCPSPSVDLNVERRVFKVLEN
jgi:hypothetical protein